MDEQVNLQDAIVALELQRNNALNACVALEMRIKKLERVIAELQKPVAPQEPAAPVEGVEAKAPEKAPEEA